MLKRQKLAEASTDHKERSKEEPTEYRSFKEITRSNEKFTKYYQANNITENENEWNEFMKVAQEQLPTTFRITGSRSHAIEIRDHLQEKYFGPLQSGNLGLTEDGKQIQPPTPLSWYPDGLGWILDGGRSVIRSNESYSALHKYLINETEIGNISRQEAVSMIPPLLLDVQRGHSVLDMCAAPGSKTAQIIEALHRQQSENEEIQGVIDGLVIANDADNKRCYTLTHQAKRLQSPALVVTNHDATVFPKITLSTGTKDGKNELLKFDRILCDVPCSGDGTMRKNVLVWKDWNPMQANGLHSLQLKILDRGCHLLKEGGLIVYSTCSLNPVENEAVISEILAKYPNSLELIDTSHQLIGLKRNPGMSSWKIMDKEGNLFNRFEEIPSEYREKFKESMFPSDHIMNQPIERCMRLYPHLQNTGGFFVALLKKTGPISAADHNQKTVGPSIIIKDTKFSGFREKPFIMMEGSADELEINEIHKYYGIKSEEFPSSQYFIRSSEAKNKIIYFCTSVVKQILQATSAGFNESLKIINTGIKAFSRNDSTAVGILCYYRMHFEFVRCLSGIMKERLVDITIEDFVRCLEHEFPNRSTLSEQCQQQLQKQPPGCLVFRINLPVGQYRVDVAFSVWVGKSTVTVYLIPEEKKSLLERLSFLNLYQFPIQ